MKINREEFEGKNFEQALIKAEDHFGLSEEEMIIETVQESTSGLLGVGAKPTIISVIPYTYIAVYAEEFVLKMLGYFDVDNISVDSSYSNNLITISVDSDNNGVLIGKNGATLNSIIHLVTQSLKNQLGIYIKVTVDVGDYKNARDKQLERLAYKISRQVAKSNVEAKLDPMNSYERRIIHSYLSEDKYVITTSEGVEPKRYVVIKPKKG